ncbi:hypothetical protein FPOAC1_011791 [Fusarium poae]|uniref:hypothetical protein n=1 Tax=Fusarium poae TaxID=36050 RepID=UPI001CE74246|nr:hypothetical protein FPOAC1_011791 [Fusarium poae]KAG8666969.1 hypothetical protein FPOAC1_011791 [Fusarium poae]
MPFREHALMKCPSRNLCTPTNKELSYPWPLIIPRATYRRHPTATASPCDRRQVRFTRSVLGFSEGSLRSWKQRLSDCKTTSTRGYRKTPPQVSQNHKN